MSKQVYNQDIAEEYCQKEGTLDNMLYVKDIDAIFMYQEDLHYYKMYSYEKFEDEVYDYIFKKNVKSITKSLVKEIIFNIKKKLLRRIESTDSDWVSIKEGKTLNLETFKIEKCRRDHYCFFHYAVHEDVIMDKEKRPAHFYKFLSEVIVDKKSKTDNELLYVLQEMFGFYLSPGLKPETVFFLIGSGANGKSVLLNILKYIIGKDFISSTSIQRITTNNFAASGLVGKKLNLCNEEESKYMKSDRFKALVSGDMIEVDRKYEPSITFEPKTKFLFATNELPSFDSINEGIRRRVKIVPFNKFVREEDRNLMLREPFGTNSKNPFNDELELIISWGLRGWQRLQKNNYKFTDSKQMGGMMEEFENIVSSALMFCREKYNIKRDDGFVDHEDLYEHYKNWCDQNGKKPMSKHKLLKDLRTNLELESITKWDGDKKKSVKGLPLISVDKIPEIDVEKIKW